MARIFICDDCGKHIEINKMADIDVRSATSYVSEKYHLCIDCWARAKSGFQTKEATNETTNIK